MNFASEVEADDLEARRAALEQIKALWELRQAERFFKRDITQLDPSASDYGKMGVLRRWLTEHPGEDLVDEEAGFRAYLQPGGRSTVYDAPSAIQTRDLATYRRLEELACFAVDGERVKAAIKNGWLTTGDVAAFSHEIEKTPMLKVDKRGE